MNRILILLLLVSSVALGMQRGQGDCTQGGKRVVSNGVNSTTRVMQSYVNLTGQTPTSGCTVTVFDTGSSNLSTIYSDNLGTVLANPFVADSTGHWYFYASGRFDVTMSGAGIASPFTIGDIKLQDLVSVYDYGAVCNGSSGTGTDDTSALQAAITAAGAAPFQLMLPGATCLFTSLTVPSNVHIVGQGRGVSVLKQVAASAVAGTPLMSSVSTSNLSFEGFTLDGNQINQSIATPSGFASDVNGMYLNDVTTVRVARMEFINLLGRPVFGAGWNDFSVRESSFSEYNYKVSNGNNSAAIELSYNYAVPGTSSNISVVDNLIDGSGGDTGGIKLAGTSTIPFSRVNVQGNNVTVGNCMTEGCLGIELYNNGPSASLGYFDARVVNNQISGIDATSPTVGLTWGISLAGAGGHDVVCADNTIRWVGLYGIEAAGNINLAVASNVLRDGAGLNILVTAPGLAAGSVHMKNNSISGNVVINPTTANEATNPVGGIVFYGENDNTVAGTVFSNNVVTITRTNYASSARGLWLQSNGGATNFSNTSFLGNTFSGPGSLYDGLTIEADSPALVTNTLVDSNTFIGWALALRIGGTGGVITNNRYTNVTARYGGTLDVSTIFSDYVESADYSLAWASLSPNYNVLLTKSGQYLQTSNGSSTPNVITWNTTNGGDCSIGGVFSTNSRQNKSTDPSPSAWTKTSSGAYARALYTTLGACRAGFGFGPATGAGPNPPIDDYEFVVEDPDNTGAVVGGGIGIGKLGVPSGSRIKNYLATGGSWTPGTIANGARNSITFSLAGCKTGDLGIAGFTLLTTQGATITASTGANSITATIANNTGGSLTFGAGTLNAGCFGF